MQEPALRPLQDPDHLVELQVELCLLLGGDRSVVERRAPVGTALVHRHRRDLAGDGGDDLHTARSGTDDGDALAGEVDRRLRPQTGVVRLTAEGLPAGHVGEERHREPASGGDQEPGLDLGTVARPHGPRAGLLVVHG